MNLTEILKNKVEGQNLFIYSDLTVSSDDISHKTKIGEIYGEPSEIVKYANLSVMARYADYSEGAKVGDFLFFDGGISSKLNEKDAVIGIVAWKNPNKAILGCRALCLAVNFGRYSWSPELKCVNAFSDDNGRQNSAKMIAEVDKSSLLRPFPAAEFCNEYSFGIKPGEGFLPAKLQMKRIMLNASIIGKSFENLMGESFVGRNFVTSTEDRSASGPRDEGYTSRVFCVNEDRIISITKKEVMDVACVFWI